MEKHKFKVGEIVEQRMNYGWAGLIQVTEIKEGGLFLGRELGTKTHTTRPMSAFKRANPAKILKWQNLNSK